MACPCPPPTRKGRDTQLFHFQQLSLHVGCHILADIGIDEGHAACLHDIGISAGLAHSLDGLHHLLIDGLHLIGLCFLECLLVLLCLAAAKGFSFFYGAINATASSKAFRMSRQKRSGMLMTLCKKELRQKLNTPIWIMNTDMGTVMAIVMTVALIVAGQEPVTEVRVVGTKVHHSEGNYIYVNSAYVGQNGLDKSTFDNFNVHEFVRRKQIDICISDIVYREKRRVVMLQDVAISGRDPYRQLVISTPLFGEDGKVKYVIAICRPLDAMNGLLREASASGVQVGHFINAGRKSSSFMVAESAAMRTVLKQVEEVASIDNVVGQYLAMCGNGRMPSEDEIDKSLDEFNAALEANGLQKVLDAAQAQLDAYAEENGLAKGSR